MNEDIEQMEALLDGFDVTTFDNIEKEIIIDVLIEFLRLMIERVNTIEFLIGSVDHDTMIDMNR